MRSARTSESNTEHDSTVDVKPHFFVHRSELQAFELGFAPWLTVVVPEESRPGCRRLDEYTQRRNETFGVRGTGAHMDRKLKASQLMHLTSIPYWELYICTKVDYVNSGA